MTHKSRYNVYAYIYDYTKKVFCISSFTYDLLYSKIENHVS